jgi:hypothetical protein
MPIPNASLATVPLDKIRTYLLNVSHPVAGPKARWFRSLGYDPSDPERLAASLLEIVQRGDTYGTRGYGSV